LAFIDASTGNLIRSIPVQAFATGRCTVSPDGANVCYIASNALAVVPTVDGPSQLFNAGAKHLTDIAFHPSGRYLAATSNDATVKLYDTTTWQVAKTFTWNIGRMRSIAFSPDGMLAAAGSDTGKVVVWDVDV